MGGSVLFRHDLEKRHRRNDMADVLYVGLQDDDKIVTFGVDARAAKLVPRAETPAVGAPSVFAVSPDRRALYVGYRGTSGIESCRLDAGSISSVQPFPPPPSPAITSCPSRGTSSSQS
jgi:6-phosphogluconolactonase (cycloisomerase 2 family)